MIRAKHGGTNLVTLTQLEYFRNLAITEHVTKTAQALHISQSALTGMIRRLEQELGQELFFRDGRSIRLNQFGKIYLQYVNSVFQNLSAGQEAIQHLKESQSQSVSFSLVGAEAWRSVISGFRNMYPGVALRHVEYTQEQFIPKLIQSQLDFVIEGGPPVESPQIDSKVIFYESLYVAVHREHRLAARTSIMLKELANEPMISFFREHSFRILCDHFCHLAGFEPRHVIECYNSLWAEAINNFDAVALCAKMQVQAGEPKEAVFIPILDSFTRYPVKIYYQRNRAFSPAMTAFFEHFIRWFQTHRLADGFE